jgi:hypothetical protein
MAANPIMTAGIVAKARSKITTNSQINTTAIPVRGMKTLVLLLMH